MSKKKDSKPQAHKPKRGRPPGKKKDADAKAEGSAPESQQGKQGDLIGAGLIAHLFVGKRDIKVKLGESGLLRVLDDLQKVNTEITENVTKMEMQKKFIQEAEDTLRARRVGLRDLEDIEEDLHERMHGMLEASKGGYRIERMDVDEVFMAGEIVTYRKGTKEEVAPRRNATAEEHEAAAEVKADGKPVNRWQKGKPVQGKPGLVLLDGGKEARADASGEWGYIGPEEDPSRPPRKRRDDKHGKKDKEPRTLPHSVTHGTAVADAVPPVELADRGPATQSAPPAARAAQTQSVAAPGVDDDLR